MSKARQVADVSSVRHLAISLSSDNAKPQLSGTKRKSFHSSGVNTSKSSRNMCSRIDYMVSHLKSADAISEPDSLSRTRKRKSGLDQNKISNEDLSLGPIDVYTPRREGRLGKDFEVLRPRLQNSGVQRDNLHSMDKSSTHVSKQLSLSGNMVRNAHILGI